MGRSPDAFFAICGETNGVYVAVVLLSFVQRAEKERFAYNTKPISKVRHHLIRHLTVTLSPQGESKKRSLLRERKK